MTYEYKCDNCGVVEDLVREVKDRNRKANCAVCGKVMKRLLGGHKINSGRGHRIPGLCTSLPGKPVYVKNKADFRELCKERNAGEPVNL